MEKYGNLAESEQEWSQARINDKELKEILYFDEEPKEH